MSGVGGAQRALGEVAPDGGPVLVMGMGATGWSVAAALADRGYSVIAADDRPSAAAARAAACRARAFEIHDASDADALRSLVAAAAAVVPAPGVAPRHASYALADAAGVPMVSELDLAAQWDSRPMAAITGTNGKTTVTVLVERMLNRSGIASVGAGNTDIALVEALDRDVAAFVVEASSFRLHRARRFAPAVAAWLNLAPDHLDWHADLRDYAASKARIWAAQGSGDLAVAPFADAAIEPWTVGITARLATFPPPDHLDAPSDMRYEEGTLIAYDTALVHAAALRRRRPHDLSNAAAAAAVALGMGAEADAVVAELELFDGLPHRLAPAGRIGGVSFHNDSKATAPHATVAALRGFTDAVLIAGGRNKGLDLADLAAAAQHVRAVVAIGDAAAEVADCFSGPASAHVRVSRAASMPEAVETAYRLARPDGHVVLSPGCASFDWYAGYGERGRHFVAAVADLAGRIGPLPANEGAQ